MNQLAIDFTIPLNIPHFDGNTYDMAQDHGRLHTQLNDVRNYMLDGQWRSLSIISSATGYPEASVSARLRDLRKIKFGGYTVQRRRVKDGMGTFQYRVGGV